MSPNLLSPVPTSIPADDSYKGSKTGSGANLYQKQIEKIGTQGKFQCRNAHMALATGPATSTHFRGTDQSYGRERATTADTLSDDVLLEIFGFILELSGFHCFGSNYPLWRWDRLVHVCRRWRQIIFSSPLRLNLQLLCTFGTPVRRRLGCWPAFPLVVDYGYIQNKDITPEDEDNIFAALEQCGRVRHIDLSVPSLLMAKLFTVMEEPFPALTHLLLSCTDGNEQVIPSKFLGGSALHLHEMSFSSIRFPTIPPILSSASDLVKLQLNNTPTIPFPFPEAMATFLATLTRLEELSIGFQSELPITRHNLTSRPPETAWIVLSAVTSFSFVGDSAYLEDFVARINTPLLKSIDIKYPDEEFIQEATELSKLIERSKLQPSQFLFAEIFFEANKTTFFLRHQTEPNDVTISIQISSWGRLGDQVMDMARMLSQLPDMISDVVSLDIEWEYYEDVMDYGDFVDINDRWLELFHPFSAVETLRISYHRVDGVDHEFDKLTTMETFTQVLPALTLVYLCERSVHEEDEEVSYHFPGSWSPPHGR